ncbi:MAG: M10 family metallopeptidase C-terminal domain-containing protein [Nostoc sp. DedQUE12a]|nr:M10 family metallopeptidase C-terminal domain-containing protein [Nostoc sp. DedQUE12a]
MPTPPNYIASLLIGSQWGTQGSPVTLTYSFMTQVPYYYSLEAPERTGFAVLEDSQKDGAVQALKLWSEVSGLKFVYDPSGSGQIRFGRASFGNIEAAHAYYPYPAPATPNPEIAGDVWLNKDDISNTNQAYGSYGFLTLVHEIGHALGLKHPGNYNAGGGGTDGPYLDDPNVDSFQYTTISYNGNSGGTEYTGSDVYPQTPQLYDIAAIQYLYGKNNNTRTGNDTYSWNATQAFVQTIWDAGGIDTISAVNQTLAAKIDLNAGSFSSIGPRSNYYNIAAKNNLAIAYDVTIENAIGSSYNDTINGNSSNNNLSGGSGNDTIYGNDGNDRVDGGSGGDYLRGGKGDDTILGGAATSGDLLYGDDGNDYIDGGAGDDQDANRGEGLKGGLGNDIILGGDGNDAVNGQEGNDLLLGGAGNDLLTGGGGVNSLLGGTGNDLYYLVYLAPNNPVVNDSGSIIQDESGTDTLNLNNFSLSLSNLSRVGTALTIDLNKDNKFIFAQDVTILDFFGTGNTKGTGFIEYIAGLDSTSFLSLVGNSPKTGTTGDDRDLSAIKGTTGNDYLGGQIGRDQIYGYAGNDILVAKGGKDELYGGTGDDLYLVSAADGFKTIIQDDGGYDALNLKDTIISLSLLQSGKVGLYRRDDNNLLIDLNKDGYATASNDLIINFFFDPTATGAKAGVGFIENLGNVSGNDVLNLFNTLPGGGRPDETINYIPSAGLGNNTYIGTNGNDFIYGGDGNDILDGKVGRDQLQGDNGNDTIYGGDGDDRRPDFTAGLKGGAGNDLIYGGYGDDIIDGQADVDIIFGDEGDDIIFGGAGNDKVLDPKGDYAALKGGGGYDTIYGGFGDDIIDGGDGDDRLYGDELNQDLLNQTQGGNDVISGGVGDDYIDTGYGNDLAWGGDGNDTLYGAAGVDRLNGDAGNDFIDGGAGNDKVVDSNEEYAALKGGLGNDTIYGSFGDDIIDGQDGNDKLYGDDKDFPGRNIAEGGNDVIFGGIGDDYIDTGYGNDTGWGGSGNDTIYGGAGIDFLSGDTGNDSLYLGLNDNAVDTVKYASGDGTDTIYQFIRGVGGDRLQFTGIAKIDVVKSGTNTQLRISDGLVGNTGFATGQLLATLSGTSGFTNADVNINLFGANFLFS